MAIRAMERGVKIASFENPGAPVEPAQEMPGFYTTAKAGDEKGVDKGKLAKQLTEKMKEIFPDPKYWAVTSKVEHYNVELDIVGREALISKLMSIGGERGSLISPQQINNELNKMNYDVKTRDRKLFGRITINCYSKESRTDIHTYTIMNAKGEETYYLSYLEKKEVPSSPGGIAVENLTSYLVGLPQSEEGINAKVDKLFLIMKEAARINRGAAFADINNEEGFVNILLGADAKTVIKAYELCKNGLSLMPLSALGLQASVELPALNTIVGMDPDHAYDLMLVFHGLEQSGHEIAEHGQVYCSAAIAAQEAKYIVPALFAVSAILSPNNKTGYSDEQVQSFIEGCGKYTAAALEVLICNRKLPEQADPGKSKDDSEVLMDKLRWIIQNPKITDETKCRIFNALIGGDKVSTRSALLPILGIKFSSFDSWQAKITEKKGDAIRADFIGLCNGAIKPGDYLKKAEKY
ncbi:MAG: hypothetical protein NTX79_01600 [Candidatus Micrarchaeota archaeon]|nr:hypothetical protein [Candidatus Micrarchaeota archaeon]